jgi:hypothetical protein
MHIWSNLAKTVKQINRHWTVVHGVPAQGSVAKMGTTATPVTQFSALALISISIHHLNGVVFDLLCLILKIG